MPILTTTSGASGFIQLLQTSLIAPLGQASIAARISTTIETNAGRIDVPIIVEDADAGWYAEGAEIAADEPVFQTIPVTPSKLAGITAVSNETIASGIGNVASMALDSLVRDIAHKLDAAYFGDLTAPAPAGLEALATVHDLTSSLSSFDVFEQARIEASKIGETITAFATDPDTLLALATAKESASSNRPLLQPAPAQSSTTLSGDSVSLLVSGVPVYASAAVTPGTIWGIPRRTSVIVLSGDPELATSADAGFRNDLTYVRATLRAGFAFTRPSAIQKITVT
jgi:HK97 family phage major capsid protein